MSTLDPQEIIRRIQRLADVQSSPGSAERAIDRARSALVALPNPTPALQSKNVTLARIAIAATVLLVLGTLATWLVSFGAGQHVAFADVQEQVKKTGTMTCTLTILTNGQPPMITRVMGNTSNQMRAERPNGDTVILNPQQGRYLQLIAKEKKAIVKRAFPMPQNLYEKLRNIRQDAVKKLPDQEIDGRKALGFVVHQNGRDMNVWVDPETHLPIRVETTWENLGGTKTQETLSDFVFDRQFDESHFDTTPPAGYTVESSVTERPSHPDEKALAPLVVSPLVGMGPVRFGMSKEEVIRLLGEPEAITRRKPDLSAAYQGALKTVKSEEQRASLKKVIEKLKESPEYRQGWETLEYNSRGFQLSMMPHRGLSTISCQTQGAHGFLVQDFLGKTKEGIAMGASQEEIEKVYGKSSHSLLPKTGKFGYLFYDELGLHFVLRNGALSSFVASPSLKKKP